MVCYNYGQKSQDTFAFVGLFLNHTCPTPFPSPPHKQGWRHVSRIFPEFPNFAQCGGREKPQADIFKKLALFYQGIQALQKITNNGFTFPMTFVQDCRFYFNKELNISLISKAWAIQCKNEFYGYRDLQLSQRWSYLELVDYKSGRKESFDCTSPYFS